MIECQCWWQNKSNCWGRKQWFIETSISFVLDTKTIRFSIRTFALNIDRERSIYRMDISMNGLNGFYIQSIFNVILVDVMECLVYPNVYQMPTFVWLNREFSWLSSIQWKPINQSFLNPIDISIIIIPMNGYFIVSLGIFVV